MHSRSMVNSVVNTFRIFQKIILWVVIAALVWSVLFIAKNYFEIPNSLISVKNQMIDNPNFIARIGEYNGYSIWYDKELAARKGLVPFSVSIKGKIDNSCVQITGFYVVKRDGNVELTKKDTIFFK